MTLNSRRQIYIQKPIQSSLAIRCVIYWCSCLVSVFLFLMIVAVLTQQTTSIGELIGNVWVNYSTAVFASLLLLPLVVWDMIKFSHRVVGPLIRLEREIQRLADGQSVRALQFREGDFWHGLARQFNSLRKQHIQLNHKARVATECKNDSIGEPVVLDRYPV